MGEVERNVYFYKVQMAEGHEWKRADVLRGLQALRGEDQLMDLGNDNYAWAIVDHVPRARETGRLRFFRDRRSNLPGFAVDFNPAELPIPEGSGLIEPTHVALAGDGLIAAEFNHFAPRIPSQFSALLRRKLGLSLTIGTYIQGSILEQLDRLTYIQLMEVSLVPTPELEDELRNAGPFGDAAAALARAEGGRRVRLELRGDKRSEAWTHEARSFVKRVLGVRGRRTGLAAEVADHAEPAAELTDHAVKTLRVTGFDPVADGIETVDLLKQKLVRRVRVEKSTQRSKVLDDSSAYQHIEDAIREVRKTDLPKAAVIF